MMQVRPAAVAGAFYPADARELAGVVDRLLAGITPRLDDGVKALVVPHAGYIYSGPIAASAYGRLVGRPIERVVLLGPSHFVRVEGAVLPGVDALATPLGTIPVEAPPGLPSSAKAHAREHSLEVQLPFLQRALGTFRIVPLAVGDAAPATIAAILDELWGGDETLIVISTDLSHYLPYASARDVDARTASAIVRLDPEAIGDDQACGAVPLRGFLLAARRRGLTARQLDLRSSGDTAGDKGRVVGYGAFEVGAVS
jgi:hypothetical protein